MLSGDTKMKSAGDDIPFVDTCPFSETPFFRCI